MTRICVSISSTDIHELLDRAQRAEKLFADIIEIRLDGLRSRHGLSKVFHAVQTPLIATNRAISERGSFDGSETERLKVLSEAVDEGFHYVDLEITTNKLDSAIGHFRKKGAKIILSHHNYFRTPDHAKLQSILTQLQEYKPDICKIVTTALSSEDNLTILSLLNKNNQNIPLVSFAMGPVGVWSRIMAPFYGAVFTYASLERGLETAPGQPLITDLREIYARLGLK